MHSFSRHAPPRKREKVKELIVGFSWVTDAARGCAGECSLKVDAELELEGVPATKVAAGVLAAQLADVGLHVLIDPLPQDLEHFRGGAHINVQLQPAEIQLISALDLWPRTQQLSLLAG